MSKLYLFVPYEPTVGTEVFKAKDNRSLKAKWLRRARQSTAKCALFRINPKTATTTLLYSVGDGEISNSRGHRVGTLAR